jgi:hypothetical protein
MTRRKKAQIFGYVIATIVVIMLITCSGYTNAYAQLPGIVSQNSLSFQTDTLENPTLANKCLFTIYPTGGGTFDVPNVGEISGLPYVTHGIRIRTAGGYYLGRFMYLSPTQINLYATTRSIEFPLTDIEPVAGYYTATLQKLVNNVWTDITTVSQIGFSVNNPQTSISYALGGAHINADLYGDNGSGQYIFLKKTLDGQPNPRVYNGQPTILAIYVTGASTYTTPPVPEYPLCSETLKINGVVSNSFLLSSFVQTSYTGVQQINVRVPSNVTSTTTFQFGVTVNDSPLQCNYPTMGNIATIPNWQ